MKWFYGECIICGKYKSVCIVQGSTKCEDCKDINPEHICTTCGCNCAGCICAHYECKECGHSWDAVDGDERVD